MRWAKIRQRRSQITRYGSKWEMRDAWSVIKISRGNPGRLLQMKPKLKWSALLGRKGCRRGHLRRLWKTWRAHLAWWLERSRGSLRAQWLQRSNWIRHHKRLASEKYLRSLTAKCRPFLQRLWPFLDKLGQNKRLKSERWSCSISTKKRSCRVSYRSLIVIVTSLMSDRRSWARCETCWLSSNSLVC